MTVVTNMSCHDYEGVMLVLSTPLQVKCYRSVQNIIICYAPLLGW